MKHAIETASKLCLFVAAFFAGSSTCVGDEPATARRVLRILSYNIHHAEGVDGRLDLARIANVIAQSQADLVALQEVDRNVARSENVPQPEGLAKQLQMHVAFGGNITLQGGQYGNAVLSRWPIIRSHNHLLPNHDEGEQRGVLQVEIQAPDKTSFVLLATHFDHRREDAERFASAKFVNDLLVRQQQSSSPQIWLLAGDCNAMRSSRTLGELLTKWTPTNNEDLPTIPVDDPTRQIDFVFVANSHAGQATAVNQPVVQIQSTRVLAEAVASDHRPILATLRF